MCGRYVLFTGDEYREITEILKEIEKRNPEAPIHTGEIRPTNAAPILTAAGDTITPESITWGFPPFTGSRVIINARSETAEEKSMFRKSLYSRRCVIPTTGFYEWDKSKHKYLYRLPEMNTLYLAGLYNEFKGERRFVILTTEAVGPAAKIHNRVPVPVYREYMQDWLFKTDFALDMMRWQPPNFQILLSE